MSAIQERPVLTNFIKYTICILASLVVLIPLWIAVMGGFKSMGNLYVDPMGLPAPFAPSQYTDILLSKVGNFWRSLANSVFVTGFTVLVTLVVCVMSGFALARMRFRLNGAIYAYFQLGILFPLAVAILPLYLQLKNFNLLNNSWGVILPQAAFQIAMQVMLLRGFFKGIPRDLEDACEIDGYGPLGFLYYMVIPLSTPILATTAIFTLVQSWNNFFLPLLVLNDAKYYTLPMGVMEFMGFYATTWNRVLAYLTLAMIPAVILYMIGQKYIVAGLTGGAVKG